MFLMGRKKSNTVHSRRQFIRFMTGVFGGLYFLADPLLIGIRWAWAESKRIILPKGTKRESLVGENPANLDTRNLEITPLEDFGTMGPTNLAIDLNVWKLKVAGQVKTPLSLTYSQLIDLPAIEREVLLICPGFFANHGRWEGVSIMELLRRAGADSDVTHVTIRGPEGTYPKVARYPVEDILSNKVFLAYKVNGKDLPRRHGFPLRLVAEGSYGYEWVKYVHEVTVEKI